MRTSIYAFCLGSIVPLGVLFGVSAAYALPNPSAKFCMDMKGTSEAVQSARGELGLCVFGKAAVEEWTLFRFRGSDAPQLQLALAHFCTAENDPSAAGPHAEKKFCESVGGKTQDTTARSGKTIKLCEFKDGSSIELQTLFLGAGHSDNADLSRVVGCN